MSRFRFVLLFVSVLILAACGGNERSSRLMIDDLELVPLKTSQISNFLIILPSVLDFSKKYRDNLPLTEQAQDAAEYNQKFFATLSQSSRFQEASRSAGFTNLNECILVYRNVLLAYVEIKNEFTNDVTNQIADLREKIAQVGKSVDEELSQKNLPRDKKQYLEDQKTELRTHTLLLSNIMVVSEFTATLDAEQGLRTN
jgi:hypothetical protein